MNSQGIDNPPREGLASSPFQQDSRWKLVLRVAASHEFCKSARLRQFLFYICEKALTDSTQDMHEQQIGLDVFGRRPGYNPGEDNIVRVAARELRRRLDRYFETEGANEPIRLQIPKGSYVPVFATRDSEFGPQVSANDKVPATETQVPTPGCQVADPEPQATSSETRLGIPWGMISWALIIALLGFGLGLLVEALHAKRVPQQALALRSQSVDAAESGTPTSLWLSLFDPQRPIIIVVSDASLALVQNLSGEQVPLEDYSNGSYPMKLATLKPELALIATRSYTSLADAVLTAQLVQTAATQHRPTIIRYARDLKMRDFKNENLVFVGSEYSDPWIQQFDAECNFTIGVDEPNRRLYVTNKAPQAGEQKYYYAAGENKRTNEDFGLITYLPDFGHTNKILILAGTNAVGTEAAGNFITDPHDEAHLAQYLGLPGNPSSFPSFQLLLKVITLNNAPSGLHAIAHRISPNSQEAR